MCFCSRINEYAKLFGGRENFYFKAMSVKWFCICEISQLQQRNKTSHIMSNVPHIQQLFEGLLFLVFLAHCVWLRFDKILNSVRRYEWQYLLFICLLELDSYTAEHTVQRAQSRATGAYYRDSLWWKARLQHFKAPTWGCRLCSLRQWCASVALCLRIKALQREPGTAQRYFFICWLWM